MKISFNNFSTPNIGPNFKSSSSFYKTEDGKEIGTFTWFFRKDLAWENFIRYQQEHFKNKDRVNIIQFGASDGTEAYTYIMSLMEYSDNENIEKFFPIMGYDIKENMVRIASGKYTNIYSTDETVMNKMSIGWKKYFKTPETEPKQHVPTTLYAVTPELKNRAIFAQGDMFELVSNIKDDSNTVLLCRNCLGYFYDQPQKLQNFIQTLSKVLKEGSLFVVGLLEEEEPYIQSLLRKNNFGQVMRNVFEKL